MIPRIAAGAIVTVLAMAAVVWWWRDRCERACLAIEREADALFERGDLVGTLRRIDEVDTRCACTRFTSGDASPLYALAFACLERLRREGREADVARVLAGARGSILREFREAAAGDVRTSLGAR